MNAPPRFFMWGRGHGAKHTHAHTHTFNGPFSGTTRVSRYQKGKTNLDFTEARDSEWQWHQLSRMQVCTLLQTDNHASTPPLSFLQAGCPSCRQINSVKALKGLWRESKCKILRNHCLNKLAAKIAKVCCYILHLTHSANFVIIIAVTVAESIYDSGPHCMETEGASQNSLSCYLLCSLVVKNFGKTVLRPLACCARGNCPHFAPPPSYASAGGPSHS